MKIIPLLLMVSFLARIIEGEDEIIKYDLIFVTEN